MRAPIDRATPRRELSVFGSEIFCGIALAMQSILDRFSEPLPSLSALLRRLFRAKNIAPETCQHGNATGPDVSECEDCYFDRQY